MSRPTRPPASARRRFLWGSTALVTLSFAAGASTAAAAEIPVTPATFANAFAAAVPGDTLLLAAGDYGRFRGAMKPGPQRVTIKAQAGAAPLMSFDFSPASNITIDGLRIRNGYVGDSLTKNITIRNSSFDGARFLARGGAGDLENANVLLDGNTHRNVDVCSGCYDGRVHIAERTEQPTGITVQNSLFEGGNADGIQNGGNGTQIIGNTFRGLHQPDDGNIAHTGSIQLYGSKNTLIKGNFFYDVSSAIGAYDRADREVIEDNVVVLDGHNAWVSEYLSDNGSIIRHNTFASFDTAGTRACAFNVPCGTIHTGHKEADPASRGTVLTDNILARIDGERSDFASGLADYNLFTSRLGWGPNDKLAQPKYVGGERPTTYEGFLLAADSPGKGAASDGADVGARIGQSGPGAPVAIVPPAPSEGLVVRMRSSLRSIVKTGRLRLAVRVPVRGTMRVRVKVRPGEPLARHSGRHSHRSVALRSVTASFRAGRTRTLTLRVGPSLRRTLGRSRDARISVAVHRISEGGRQLLGTGRLSAKRSSR